MSIQSEIERISQAKTDIHSSIESKGVTVPDDTLISEMAPYIQQIREAGTVVTSVSDIGPDESGNAQLKNLRIHCGEQDITYNGGEEQTLTISPATVGAATAAQGTLAQTAVQPAQIADFITAEDIPDELPNPYALNIQLNGGSTTTYDGSATKNVNITPTSINAAPASHSSSYTIYGVGSSNYYGHVKLLDTISSSDRVSSGYAATPYAVYNYLNTYYSTKEQIDENFSPYYHPSETPIYGMGSINYYGHVKLSDTASSEYGQINGVAATPKCVHDAIASLSPTKIVLLWTNSRPNNTFGAQKVSLSLSGYHAVLVLGWSYQAKAVCSSVFVPVGSKGVITLVGIGTAYRNFTTSTTGITFEAASVENTATPYKIYGIKL